MDAERRPWDRAVVSEHAHRWVAHLLGGRRDPQLNLIAVIELEDRRIDDLGEASSFGWEITGPGRDVVSVFVHVKLLRWRQVPA